MGYPVSEDFRSIYLSNPSTYLSIYLPTYLPTYPSIYLIYPSIYPCNSVTSLRGVFLERLSLG
jgi:hypothetical protein